MEFAADDEMLESKLTFMFHEQAGDNLSEIMEGVGCYYIDRRKECGFVGPNTHWIRSAGGGKFRCPDCGQQYHPWVKIEGSETFLPAQRILIFGMLDTSPAKASFELRSPALFDLTEFRFPTAIQTQLTLWPDTVTESLINEFKAKTTIVIVHCHWSSCLYKCEFVFLKEITAIWLKEWVDKPFAALEQELIARSMSMQRNYFQKKTLSTDIMMEIDKLNANGLLKKWVHAHLEGGYLGFNYRYTEGEAVLSAREVMRMWGLSKFLMCSYKHNSRL